MGASAPDRHSQCGLGGIGEKPRQLVGTGDSFAFFGSSGERKPFTEFDAELNLVRSRTLDLPSEYTILGWNGNSFLASVFDTT